MATWYPFLNTLTGRWSIGLYSKLHERLLSHGLQSHRNSTVYWKISPRIYENLREQKQIRFKFCIRGFALTVMFCFNCISACDLLLMSCFCYSYLFFRSVRNFDCVLSYYSFWWISATSDEIWNFKSIYLSIDRQFESNKFSHIG